VTTQTPQADVLVIGAHPDDVELGCGGILAKLCKQQRYVVILDLTQGELGSRGSAELRQQEARRASELLGIACRETVGLPDGGLANTNEQQRRIIPYIRKHRPRVLIALMAPDRHPDHAAAHALSRDANYYAGLSQIDTDQEPYRAPQLYYFHPYTEYAGSPACVVDISDTFETKLQALQAYESQFHNPSFNGASTFISTQSFWENIEIRARFWGHRIGTTYGEPLYHDGPLALDTLPGI